MCFWLKSILNIIIRNEKYFNKFNAYKSQQNCIAITINIFYSQNFMLTPSRYSSKPNPELGNSRQYNTKCVCQICTCGKHHCPEKYTKFQGETTNHHDFKPYNIVPQGSNRHQHHVQNRHYDPQLLKSSYRATYTPHRLEKQCPAHKHQYVPNKAKFQGQTQYHHSYVPNQIKMDRPHTGVQYVPNRARFDGTTTYKREFSPKKVDYEQRREVNYERKQIPFQGKTTYQSQYVPHQIEAQRPDTTNMSRYQPNPARFEGQSRYKEAYKGYQVQKHDQCPITNLPQYPRQCSTGKTHVNFSAEKNSWE